MTSSFAYSCLGRVRSSTLNSGCVTVPGCGNGPDPAASLCFLATRVGVDANIQYPNSRLLPLTLNLARLPSVPHGFECLIVPRWPHFLLAFCSKNCPLSFPFYNCLFSVHQFWYRGSIYSGSRKYRTSKLWNGSGRAFRKTKTAERKPCRFLVRIAV